MKKAVILLAAAIAAVGCSKNVSTSQVLLTAASGEKCAETESIVFKAGTDAEAIQINANEKRQTIDGIGASLTESSAFVLACLPEEDRKAILNELFSESGANFSMARTQIGASDFSVEGFYSLCDTEGDTALTTFSLDRDKEGFSKTKYPQIVDENYDLYHLMKEVAAIKQAQKDPSYKIVANCWTAPHWMKDNHQYYEPHVRGGALLHDYYQTYANYLAKYLEAWRAEGVEIWGMTPVNEPRGNGGGWESMDMNGAEEADFIANYMGPTLKAKGFGDVQILGFDQNIGEVMEYAEAIYGDEVAKSYCSGMALHWYDQTHSVRPDVLDKLHEMAPDKKFLHTEGCVDNLGCTTGWGDITDPVGYQEHDFFNNDAFWWECQATDWGYSHFQFGNDHMAYVPTHRYAMHIIDGMNHWMTGFIDWNIVLDSIGGNNHVDNFCGAPVMVDYKNHIIYYTPYYYVMKQLSKAIRPGDVVLGISDTQDEDLHILAVEKKDGSYAICILNEKAEAIQYKLQLKNHVAEICTPASSVQTMTVKL